VSEGRPTPTKKHRGFQGSLKYGLPSVHTRRWLRLHGSRRSSNHSSKANGPTKRWKVGYWAGGVIK
jgi:hypothetical protein